MAIRSSHFGKMIPPGALHPSLSAATAPSLENLQPPYRDLIETLSGPGSQADPEMFHT